MKFIFHDPDLPGEMPVLNYQLCCYDYKDNKCFDEFFIDPNEINGNDLTYLHTDEDEENDMYRLFANMKDGNTYELILKKVDKSKCSDFYGG